MAGRYKAYPEYKDSEVELLGVVPRHWDVFQLKRSVDGCANGIWGAEPKGDDKDTIVLRVADFDRNTLSLNSEGYTHRRIEKKEKIRRALKQGDLLLEKSGGGESTLVGQVVLFDKPFEAVTSNFVAKMTPLAGFESRFLNYSFSRFYDVRINYCSIKQNTGIQNLDSAAYLSEKFCFPPHPEQKQIAHFLDHETGKIDALIEKQQALITLLKEKRQAVISHAVTKGLNPEARMKDSGVEWLGDVPDHWRTGKFTHYIQIRHGHQFRDYDFTGEGIKIIKITQLHRDGYLDLSSCSTVASGRDREFPDIQIRENDVLMCLTGGTIGKIIRVGEVNEPLLQNYRVGHFSHANQLLTNDYIYYLMSSDVILRQINFLLRETGQPNIGMEDFGGMKICIPCLEEQDSICSYIEESLPKFDDLISHAEMQVNLLQERRTALISAAVTGKIDVRDWEPAESLKGETV